MNWTRRLGMAVLALGIGLGLTGGAQAQVQTSSDSLTVTITPNAYYALQITTAAGGVSSTGGMDLGSVNLSASTYTVHPATLTVYSTYATTDLQLTGQINTSGGTAWQFDQNTSNMELDKLASWALFTDTSVATTPIGEFNGTVPGGARSGVISGSGQNVGTSGLASSLFQETATASGFKLMKNIPGNALDGPASKSYLWLGFRLPNATTSVTQQAITLTLVAVAPH